MISELHLHLPKKWENREHILLSFKKQVIELEFAVIKL